MEKAGKVARFFNNSPKRQVALDKFIDELHQSDTESSKRKKLKDLCRTRWVERHDAFEAFIELYTSTVHCLEEILTAPSDWNRETVSDARSLCTAITDFGFIVTLVITKNLLSNIKGLSVKLQGRWQDVIRAHKKIKSVTESLEDVRKNVESFHSQWYEEACSLASGINSQPSMPRIAQRQTHRANVPASTPKDYFRRVVTIPFVDHLILELNSRFSVHSTSIIEVLRLLPPSVYAMETRFTKQDISNFITKYSDDLPSVLSLDTELHCWNLKWKHDKINSDRHDTVVKTLQVTDPDDFPNIHLLLQVAATLPVTSCECERSISKLKSFL